MAKTLKEKVETATLNGKYEYCVIDGKTYHKSAVENISKTRPNESYTIKELWQRWTQGNTPMTTKSIYFDSDNGENLEDLDIQDSEMIDRVDISEFLEKQQQKYSKNKLAAKNLEKRIQLLKEEKEALKTEPEGE